MQALVIVIMRSDSTPPPRRQVAAGRIGPGIARIIIDEWLAEREGIIDAEGSELPQSVRTA
jgi:hypothetical protein